MTINRCIIVRGHVDGIPGAGCFAVTEQPVPAPPVGGVTVHVRYASVDPAMRGWLGHEANYMTVPVGAVMRAHGVGEVVASDHPVFDVGDVVYGLFGWADYFAAQADDIWWKIDTTIAPEPAWLNVLGLNGLTAWIGLHHFGRPKTGEILLVTTAAGAVGSTVGQLARAAGLTPFGIAGGPEKVARACAEFGYEGAIDYRGTDDLDGAIADLCPDGIDIFYDNVAGAQADAIFPCLNMGARIVQCGTASVANWTPVPQGPRRERLMLVKRLSWAGFVAFDHRDLFAEALASLADLYRAGALRGREHILQGLENAPNAIARLYRGENEGKLCIAL